MNDDLQELPYRVEFRFRKHEGRLRPPLAAIGEGCRPHGE